MFVSYYGKTRAFISNYSSWHQYQSQGRITEVATSLISHETLHLTLNKFSASASAKLDNLFGRSNRWENYIHGLGDIDRVRSICVQKYKYAQKGHSRSHKKKKNNKF
jgi:hypothetical protein